MFSQILSILCNSKFHNRVQINPPPTPALILIIPVHTFQSCFFHIRFNILHSTPIFFSNGLFFFQVAYYFILKLKGRYCGVMGWIHVSERLHFAGRDLKSVSIKVDGFI